MIVVSGLARTTSMQTDGHEDDVHSETVVRGDGASSHGAGVGCQSSAACTLHTQSMQLNSAAPNVDTVQSSHKLCK